MPLDHRNTAIKRSGSGTKPKAAYYYSMFFAILALPLIFFANAQAADSMIEEAVQIRIEQQEIAHLRHLEQLTPEQYQQRNIEIQQHNTSFKRRVAQLPRNQQQAFWQQVNNSYSIAFPPIQQKWQAEEMQHRQQAQALSQSRAKEMQADVQHAAELQTERTFLQRQVDQGKISKADAQPKDDEIIAAISALQNKYVGYGESWANNFNSQMQQTTARLVADRDRKEKVEDTTSEVGKDAHRAAELNLSLKRNQMRRAVGAIDPASEIQENAPLKAELDAIQAKYAVGALLAASADDFRQRTNTLVNSGSRQVDWEREARAEYTAKHPRPVSVQPGVVAGSPSSSTSFVSTVMRGIGNIFSFIMWGLGIYAVFRFFKYIKKRRQAILDKNAKARNEATRAARAPDIAAWNKLGSTPEEREKNIKKMFDTKQGSLSFGTRWYFRGKAQVQRAVTSGGTQQVWEYNEDCFIEFRISRSIAAMEQKERDFLRTAYLLFNSGKLDEQQWRYYSFAFINGDGKASIDNWNYWFPSEEYVSHAGIKNGPDAVRFFQNGTDASVDSAVNALMGLLEKLGAQGDTPAAAKEALQRVHGGGAWLTSENIPDTLFAGNGLYAVRLGLLDGSNEVLSYAGEGSLMTIAPPGSGKTQCFVLPNMLSWPGPAVVLDVKGEIFAATSKWRTKNVGPVFKFSPLDPANSNCYNPLVFVRQDPEYLWEDARFLADMMIVPSGASDPFWENTARDVLTSAIAYVCYENAPEQRPMSMIMDLLYGMKWDDMVLALRTNLAVGAMRQMGHSLSEMDKKMRDSVLKTAQSSMSAWQGERIAKSTSKSDWSPLDLRTGKPTIYICVNPNEIDSLLSVLRVLIAQHIRMLTSELPARDTAPVLFVLDELPRLKKMPPVDEALNIGRQYGIRLWMFTQSYGQLKEAYPNAEGMLGSCAVRTFMNVPLNDELAQKLSDQLGYREGTLDNSRIKLVEPLELAGPDYRDIALVLASNTKPAKVRKAFAYQDAELKARMATS